MLRRTVREVSALAQLTEITRTEGYAKAVKDGFTGPFATLYTLVVHPVNTVTGVPKGVWALLESTEASIGAQESQYEDNELEAFLSLSKHKRQYASELNIDVYTKNQRVQEELNRVGWAAVAGNWTPTFATAPISLPASPIVTGLDWVGELNDILTQAPPGVLRAANEDVLIEMGIPDGLRLRFLDQPLYSPRHETVIVRCLRSMKAARGREQFIELAVAAQSETGAFVYQQVAELLAGYQRERSPIVEILPHGGLPVGRSKDNTLVFCFPVDYGRWTSFTEGLFKGLAGRTKSDAAAKSEIWITGVLTPRCKKELEALGFHVTENADTIIKMMD